MEEQRGAHYGDRIEEESHCTHVNRQSSSQEGKTNKNRKDSHVSDKMKRLLVLISPTHPPNLSIYWQCKMHTVYLICSRGVLVKLQYICIFLEGMRSLQCKFYFLSVFFLRIYNSNNNTNFMNKTILRLTDLLLSENPFHFIYFLKKKFSILLFQL